MPGTPATTTRLLIPRYSNADNVDFAGQVNAISDMVDSKVAKIPTRTIWTPSTTPAVTPFPTSPADGDIHYFGWPASGGRPSGHWAFRYNSSASKWEVIGGVPMRVRFFSGWSPSVANSWQAFPTFSGSNASWGSLYIPWTGPFELKWGFRAYGQTNDVQTYMGIVRDTIDTGVGFWTYSEGSGGLANELYIAADNNNNTAMGFFDMMTSDGFANGAPQNWTAGWRIRPLYQVAALTYKLHDVWMTLMPLEK